MTRLREHDGVISAAALALIGLTGLILAIGGGLTGHTEVSDSGLAILMLAGLAGWSMRHGYKAAMRKRRSSESREMDSRLASMEDIYEQIQEAAERTTDTNIAQFPGASRSHPRR